MFERVIFVPLTTDRCTVIYLSIENAFPVYGKDKATRSLKEKSVERCFDFCPLVVALLFNRGLRFAFE